MSKSNTTKLRNNLIFVFKMKSYDEKSLLLFRNLKQWISLDPGLCVLFFVIRLLLSLLFDFDFDFSCSFFY